MRTSCRSPRRPRSRRGVRPPVERVDQPRLVDDHHRLRHRVEDRAEMGLAGAQLRLHLLLLFDAEDDPRCRWGRPSASSCTCPRERSQHPAHSAARHGIRSRNCRVPQHALDGVARAWRSSGWTRSWVAAKLVRRSVGIPKRQPQVCEALTRRWECPATRCRHDLVEGLPEVLGRQRFAAPLNRLSRGHGKRHRIHPGSLCVG